MAEGANVTSGFCRLTSETAIDYVKRYSEITIHNKEYKNRDIQSY